MCSLGVVLAFVIAHIVASSALGGGWRGAGRAPFAVFFPALALLLLDAVWSDSYADLGRRIGLLASWEMLYFFLYACLRIAFRPAARAHALPRR
jgi:hypothetical protein